MVTKTYLPSNLCDSSDSSDRSDSSDSSGSCDGSDSGDRKKKLFFLHQNTFFFTIFLHFVFKTKNAAKNSTTQDAIKLKKLKNL